MPLPVIIPAVAALATKVAAVAGTVLASKAAIAAGVAVAAATVVTVAVVTVDSIREKIREWMKKTGTKVMSAKVTECFQSGKINVVKIGLHDDQDDLCGEMEIDGKKIASDIRVGMRIAV